MKSLLCWIISILWIQKNCVDIKIEWNEWKEIARKNVLNSMNQIYHLFSRNCTYFYHISSSQMALFDCIVQLAGASLSFALILFINWNNLSLLMETLLFIFKWILKRRKIKNKNRTFLHVYEENRKCHKINEPKIDIKCQITDKLYVDFLC